MPIAHAPKLFEWITDQDVLLTIPADNKKKIFEAFAAHGVKNKKLKASQVDDVVAGLLKREKLGTTGLGNGIAVPHTELEGLKKTIVLLGVSQRGVEFHSLDGEAANFFMVLILPLGEKETRLILISQFCRMSKDHFVMEKLREARTAAEVIDAIKVGG